MKTIIFTLLIFTGVTISMDAQVREKETFTLDVQKSVLYWKGSSLFSFGEHYGTVMFKEGNLKITNGYITGGKFIIDMNTIVNTDGDYNEGLVMHLKDNDFFDVFHYVTSRLVMTHVKYINESRIQVTADLTIKGITKSIEYEATIDASKGALTSKFIIDRTRWNIMFASKSITNIKEHILSDAIEFEAKLYF